MNKKSKASVAVSRPKDTSLAAYKAWITATAKRLTTEKTQLELTDKEWVENWKQYWKQKKDS